jgi:hypothetical protein
MARSKSRGSRRVLTTFVLRTGDFGFVTHGS